MALRASLVRGAWPAGIDRRLGLQGHEIFVGEPSFADLPTDMKEAINKVPIRLKLAVDEVDRSMKVGRMATRMTPKVNGFIPSLEGNPVEGRIKDGIASGGQKVMPLGN